MTKEPDEYRLRYNLEPVTLESIQDDIMRFDTRLAQQVMQNMHNHPPGNNNNNHHHHHRFDRGGGGRGRGRGRGGRHTFRGQTRGNYHQPNGQYFHQQGKSQNSRNAGNIRFTSMTRTISSTK